VRGGNVDGGMGFNPLDLKTIEKLKYETKI